jgi:hypothetical protein
MKYLLSVILVLSGCATPEAPRSIQSEEAISTKYYDIFPVSMDREIEHSKIEMILMSQIIGLKMKSGEMDEKVGKEKLEIIKKIHEALVDRWVTLDAKQKELKKGHFYYYRKKSDFFDSGFALIEKETILFRVVF